MRELTTDAGVDVVSFGGTKNGLVFGEAVVFLQSRARRRTSPSSASSSVQLASKMRFVSAQLEALLDRRPLAAQRLARQRDGRAAGATPSAASTGLEIVHPVEANGVFARLPRPAIDAPAAPSFRRHPFYVWDEADGVVRWMCSWDTTPEDVDAFAAAVADALR